MSNKVNAKLYRVQELITDVNDTEELIVQMIEEYYAKSGKDFLNVSLRDNLNSENFQSKLFVYTTEQRKPNWINFLDSIVENEEDLNQLEAKSASFILFLYNENRIYAISKGYFGRFLLDQYMDKFFGLEVLSRLVDKNVTEIRKLEERGVFGVILGAERFFREEYNLAYEDDFGKIYKAMLASIDEEHFDKLGITKKRDDTTHVSIAGSSSFEVSTNFDYNELIQRINRIEDLLQTPGVQFNQFYRLTINELKSIKNNLDIELIKMAYESYVSGESVDFYHPDIFNYMKAIEVRFNVIGDYLEIPLGHSIGFVEVIKRLVEKNIIDSSTEENFIQSMIDCSGGFTINEDGIYSNEISLDQWIGGEIEFDSNRFFKLDNHWYKYREGFNDYLDNHINDIDFDLMAPPNKLNDWDYEEHKREGDYNDHYHNVRGVVVTDTAFLYYLEVCDLIRITDGMIYLYHVKKGLGRDLRVLANQIVNASRVLANVVAEENNESLDLYYDAISNKQYNNKGLKYIDKDDLEKSLNKENFFKLFKENKISFVFAYSSSSVLDIKDELISTNSRIAKLSLLYCIRDMKLTDYNFLVERIKKV